MSLFGGTTNQQQPIKMPPNFFIKQQTYSYSRGGGMSTLLSQTEQKRAVLTQDPLFDRVWAIRNAYDPKSTFFKFCFVFYNRKKQGEEPPEKPKNFTVEDWIRVQKDCPDPEHLIPYAAIGFPALESRVESQKKIAKDIEARVQLLQTKLREMGSFYATELQSSLDRVKQNTNKISQLLLASVANEEVTLHQGVPLTDAEKKVLEGLEKMQLEISAPRKYSSAIADLAIKARAANKRKPRSVAVDREALNNLSRAAANNQSGIETLQDCIKELRRRANKLQDLAAEAR